MSHVMTPARRGFWSIVIAGTLWGTTGVATQALYALSTTNVLSLVFLRLSLAGLLLLLVCWRTLGRHMWCVKGRDALLMVFLGAMQAISHYCYVAAIPYCGVTIATLISLCIAPVIVVLFAALFLRERVTCKMLLALFCALSGTALLTGAPDSADAFHNLLPGVLLSFSTAVGMAGMILGERMLSNRYHPLQVNTAAFMVSALLLLMFSPVTHLVLTYPATGWLLIFYLGSIPTALAYVLFQSGMRSTPATLTSILTLCEPLTAAVLAWFLFNERLGLPGILGALLLLTTIFLLARHKPS